MTNTERLAEALRRIHNLCGGDAWEYRRIALEALAAHEAAESASIEEVTPQQMGEAAYMLLCCAAMLSDPDT